MILDPFAIQQQKEQDLGSFLDKRKAGIADELSTARRHIEAGRTQALGTDLPNALTSIAQGANLDPSVVAGGFGNVQDRLGRNLNVTLAGQGRDLGNQRLNLIYQKAREMAINAGRNMRDAESFARKYVDDQIRRQNESSANQVSRDQAGRTNDINIAYQNQLAELESQYQPQNSVKSALTRIAVGLPVQLLTQYGLNKWGAKSSVSTGQTSRTPSGYGNPTLNERPNFNAG